MFYDLTSPPFETLLLIFSCTDLQFCQYFVGLHCHWHTKTEYATFEMITKLELVSSLLELSVSSRLWELYAWLWFWLPAIWSRRESITTIICCISLIICCCPEVKETKSLTKVSSLSVWCSFLTSYDTNLCIDCFKEPIPPNLIKKFLQWSTDLHIRLSNKFMTQKFITNLYSLLTFDFDVEQSAIAFLEHQEHLKSCVFKH